MFCTNCGAKIVDGAKFCSSCGAKVPQKEDSIPTSIHSSVVVPSTEDMPVLTSTVISTDDTEESGQGKIKGLTQKLGNKVNQVTDSITSKIPDDTTEAIGSKVDSMKSSVSSMVNRVKQENADSAASSQSNETEQVTTSQIYSSEVTDQGMAPLQQQESYKAKEKSTVQKFGDKITDTVGSALGGKKVETIRISMGDMIDLIKKHYIDFASTEEEYDAIQKTVNGNMLIVKQLDSKDGNYHIAVRVGGTIDVLNPNDCNWIRVTENSTGKVYQYSALKWGNFKKAMKTVIDAAKQ